MRKKLVMLPYDFDTAIGINNEGALVFSYNLEDIDKTESGADVYNGQDSVLWINVRQAFFDEIRAMYQDLRSRGVLSYDVVEKMFEDHQAKWPEAIWIEDSRFKYLLPLIEKGNGSYLSMLQGSKEQQRKWWLTNRFRYEDSKYNAGDALTDVITLRGYAKADITVRPYADIYASIKYGSYLQQVRAHRNQNYTIPCPLDNINDTEIYIYSSKQLASVGDLSGLQVGYADFSTALKLQELKLGDADANYSNGNMKELYLGNNRLLRKIDLRNCVGLGTGDMKSVDISGCKNVEEVYFDGTQITGLTLPNGGILKKLHVPATMTNLTIQNQKAITEFSIPSYNNISTLRLENNSSVIDTYTILQSIPAASRVRLIGFTWEAQDADEIEDMLDLLDTMRGLDENGNNVDQAQVSGIIHTNNLTGAQIASFNERYRYLRIQADHTTSYLTFVGADNTTVVKTVTCIDGVMQDSAPSVPSKADSADGHYSYTAVGWNTVADSEVNNPAALTNVSGDRTVYPAYSKTVKKYTVKWVNQGTTVETDSDVPWGTKPTFNGSTPTYDGQTSTGWLPDPTQPITGNTTFTAQYLPVYTITFKNDTGSTTLDTQRVVQGQTATYGGETPVSSEDTSLAFLGWATSANSHTANAVLTNIQASTTVYAAFESAVEVAEITDSWDTIIANIDNGTYSTKYKVGNYKPLDLGTEGTINMQIVAMDADELASGGTAPLTFGAMELLNSTSSMNNRKKSDGSTTGFGVGGWGASDMRTFLKTDTLLKIPNVVKARIQKVIKTSSGYTVNGQVTDRQTIDNIWLFSRRELNLPYLSSYETIGPVYSAMFNSESERVRKTSNETATSWWTRSGYYIDNFVCIEANGTATIKQGNNSLFICFGFCLGLEQETIEDDWATVTSNQNYATDYSVGDTKTVDLSSIGLGKHLAEIIAMNTDDKADGNGKAGITWMLKDQLAVAKAMNSAQKTYNGETAYTAGGWENSDLRAFLRSDVMNALPTTLKNGIVPVTKVQSTYTGGALVKDGQTTSETLWIPGHHEVFGTSDYETTGAIYSSKFTNAASRIIKRNGSASGWWLRSVGGTGGFRCVNSSGYSGSNGAYSAYGVVLCFCTN